MKFSEYSLILMLVAFLSAAGGFKVGHTLAEGDVDCSTEIASASSQDSAKVARLVSEPLAKDYFNVISPAIYRNHDDSDDPNKCTSIEFKATILNRTEKKHSISTDFHIKDAQGITLDVVNTYYVLDSGAGTKEHRVLKSFSFGRVEFLCKDIAAVELRYSSFEDQKQIALNLPIIDND